MSTRPFLEVSGITVRFGGLVAVNSLSFEVARGSIHALIGPNGAGKSTTFNCISRYYQPSAAMRLGLCCVTSSPSILIEPDEGW